VSISIYQLDCGSLFSSLDRFHFSAKSIISSPQYQEWMERFGKTTNHIFIGEDCCGNTHHLASSFMSSCVYNSKLSTLFGNIFQYLLPVNAFASQPLPEPQSSSQFNFGQNLMKYCLLPVKKQGIEYPSNPILQQYDELNLFIEETLKSYSYLQDFSERKALIQQQWTTEKKDFEVICLGTGCAIPSKYRNVSSLLILIPSTNNGVLLDCGEGTWYQLMHIDPLPLPSLSGSYNPSFESLKNHSEYRGMVWTSIIKLVWISHPHADHHLGLINVILQRKKYFQLLSSLATSPAAAIDSSVFSPLIVVAPMIVFSFLKDASAIYPGLESWFYFIPSNYFDPSENCTACARSALPFPSSTILIPSFPTSSQTFNVPGMERKKYCRESVAGMIPIVGETTIAEDDKAIDQADAVDAKAKKRPKLMKLSYSDYFEKHMEKQKDFIQQQLTDIGILSFCNIPVIHCKQSYGLIFSIQPSSSYLKEEEIKIVYSGDTRPCDLLAYYGKNASLLIHEATFEDDKVIEAINKKHSTINEACEIGQLMNCKAILLTHFSQRYHGVPLQFHPKGQNPIEIVDNLLAKRNGANINTGENQSLVPIIAFDFMRFSNKDVGWLPYLTYTLAEIFAKEAVEEEKLIE
jgi:ribonuclease BN (tRNA processing enzyme)